LHLRIRSEQKVVIPYKSRANCGNVSTERAQT
jgi:hypothetical protein